MSGAGNKQPSQGHLSSWGTQPPGLSSLLSTSEASRHHRQACPEGPLLGGTLSRAGVPSDARQQSSTGKSPGLPPPDGTGLEFLPPGRKQEAGRFSREVSASHSFGFSSF